jgi:hypothetical protein
LYCARESSGMAEPEPSKGKLPMKRSTVENDSCSDDDFMESDKKPSMGVKPTKAAGTATKVLPEQLRGYFPSITAAHAALVMWELQYGKKRKIIRMEKLSGGNKCVYRCVSGEQKDSENYEIAQNACGLEIILRKTKKKDLKSTPFFFNAASACLLHSCLGVQSGTAAPVKYWQINQSPTYQAEMTKPRGERLKDKDLAEAIKKENVIAPTVNQL